MHARGPFINYDHFANYLAMIFPLALGGADLSRHLRQTRVGKVLSIVCRACHIRNRARNHAEPLTRRMDRPDTGAVVFVGVMLSLPVEKRPALFQISSRGCWNCRRQASASCC